MNEEIGERIKEIRKKRDLTREQLSCQTGISIKHLYCIETGKTNLTVDKLKKYAKN